LNCLDRNLSNTDLKFYLNSANREILKADTIYNRLVFVRLALPIPNPFDEHHRNCDYYK